MTSFMDTFQHNPMAVVFGVLGLACQLAWPIFCGRKKILSVQFGIGANYGIQYALLDAWSGAGIAGLGALQTVVALLAGDRPWLRKMGMVFLPLVALMCLITWSGPSSLMALAACSLVMIARMQKDTLHLRLLMLSAAPFGMGYDILVGAVPTLCGAILSATIAAIMLLRELRARGYLSLPAATAPLPA